jgi:hypothetical protein
MELPTHQFGDYTLRPATAEDLPLAVAWNAADPDHRWEAEQKWYWVEQQPYVNAYVLCDATGPLFFFRMIRLVTAQCRHCLKDFTKVGRPGEVLHHRCKAMAGNRVDTPSSGAIEINIQFERGIGKILRGYTALALADGMAWLEKTLPANGIFTVYFNSKSLAVIGLAENRLGFRFESAAKDGYRRYKRVIPANEAQKYSGKVA